MSAAFWERCLEGRPLLACLHLEFESLELEMPFRYDLNRKPGALLVAKRVIQAVAT